LQLAKIRENRAVRATVSYLTPIDILIGRIHTGSRGCTTYLRSPLVKARLRQAFVGTSAVKFAENRGYSHHLTFVKKKNSVRLRGHCEKKWPIWSNPEWEETQFGPKQRRKNGILELKYTAYIRLL